jgi:hypothetical protein
LGIFSYFGQNSSLQMTDSARRLANRLIIADSARRLANRLIIAAESVIRMQLEV